MATGRVKWWNEEKGYGFITDTTGKDLFVHSSEFQDGGLQTLQDGAEVEFQEVAAANGPMAINVRLVGEHAASKRKDSLASTVPPDVKAKILAKARSEWPDDYEMQAYVVKNQTEAWLSLNS